MKTMKIRVILSSIVILGLAALIFAQDITQQVTEGGLEDHDISRLWVEMPDGTHAPIVARGSFPGNLVTTNLNNSNPTTLATNVTSFCVGKSVVDIQFTSPVTTVALTVTHHAWVTYIDTP